MKNIVLASVVLLVTVVSSFVAAADCSPLASLDPVKDKNCQIPAAGLPLGSKDRDLGGTLTDENGTLLPLKPAPDLIHHIHVTASKKAWRLSAKGGRLISITSLEDCSAVLKAFKDGEHYCWLGAGVTLGAGTRDGKSIDPVNVDAWMNDAAPLDVGPARLTLLNVSSGQVPGGQFALLKVTLAPPAASQCPPLASLAEKDEGCQIPTAGLTLGAKDRDLGEKLVTENDRLTLKPDLNGTFYLRLDPTGRVLRLVAEGGRVTSLTPLQDCAATLKDFKNGERYCWLDANITLDAGTRDGKPIDPVNVDTWKSDTPIDIKATHFSRVALSVGEAAANDDIVILKLTPATSAAPAATSATTPVCEDDVFELPDRDRLWDQCQENGYLCVTPSGQVVHQPSLEEGRSVIVVLLQPEIRGAAFELEVNFKRSLILDLKKFDDLQDSGVWGMGARRTVELPSAGTLHVTTRLQAKVATRHRPSSTGQDCVVPTTLEKTNTFDVKGHYHFMLGIMPTYAGLFDRKPTLNRSDDGVQRVYEQDIHEVDWVLTLSGYPWGASLDDFGAVGIVVGTSARDIGERWYVGLDLNSPIGLGIAGGAAVIVVPELDQDFVTGQPLTDTQVPVHNSAVVTWFLGINIEAHLFALAFKGLTGDDD